MPNPTTPGPASPNAAPVSTIVLSPAAPSTTKQGSSSPNTAAPNKVLNPKEYIGPHFRYDEFRCKHCGKLPPEGMDPILVLRLEILRTLLGDKPIIIHSGYRCPIYNKAVKGDPESQHMVGKAADIMVKCEEPSAVATAAELVFYNGGLGRYKDFTHVDTRGHKARW